jgi:hypothetical protein
MEYDYEPIIDENSIYRKNMFEFEDYYSRQYLSKYDFFSDNDNLVEYSVDWRNNLKMIFNSEYTRLCKGRNYFYGCPFELYTFTYETRLKSFVRRFTDVTESDFIDFELKRKISYPFIFKSATEQIVFSIKARNKFLNDKLYNKENPEAIDISKPNKPIKDYKKTIWFRTGLKLATGEAYDLYDKYKLDKGHFTKICLDLGFNDTDRPYFSETINDNKGDKNTFSDKDKLKKLHRHIAENNLNFGNNFLEKYDQIGLE